ncbi:MAG TPA: hypothetical protein VJS30_06780 [Paraburkholderia sp.]|nr:hypothetical protein [Paraburkholderia sp.]
MSDASRQRFAPDFEDIVLQKSTVTLGAGLLQASPHGCCLPLSLSGSTAEKLAIAAIHVSNRTINSSLTGLVRYKRETRYCYSDKYHYHKTSVYCLN